MGVVRAALGFALGVLARLWLKTLRVEVDAHPSLESVASRPWVLAFLHGKQWPLLAWKRRRRTVVMVSLSNDGEMQSRALSVLGLSVVRGSSSRGGARGLAALVRELRRGDRDAAFAVDGPRGPYGVPKPGLFLAARRANAVIVPVGSAITAGKVFEKAWDRFALSWPFSRVSVVLGPPLDPPADGEVTRAHTRELSVAVAEANDTAGRMLAAARSRMLPFVPTSSVISRGSGDESTHPPPPSPSVRTNGAD